MRGVTGFVAAGDYEVVIELDAWAADDLRARQLHWSQELTAAPNGIQRLRMRLNNLEEVEGWVLSMGTHATVLRPKELRERLRQTTVEVWQRYARGSATCAS